MDFNLQPLLAILHHYGYGVMFLIAVAEGPIVGIVAGALVAAHYFNPLIAFGVLAAGDVVGDTLWYALGRYGGRPFVARWGRRIRLNNVSIDRVGQYFDSHGWKMLLLGKTQLGSLPTGLVVLFVAGMSRMPLYRYITFNGLGTLPRIAFLEAVGFFCSGQIAGFGGRPLALIVTAVSTIILVLFSTLWARRYVRDFV